MQRDQWQHVQDLYFKALEIPQEQRRPFLESACPDDPSIVQEVESLLKCEDKLGGFLDPVPDKTLVALRASVSRTQPVDSDDFIGAGQDPVGLRVSHYRILSLIGSGGMGQVYLALDEKLERNVAIKFLPTHLDKEVDNVRRFIREARAVSALNHPHIVTIHESGECELGFYIVMEFVNGRTLREAISEGLSYREILEYATQMAKAVSASHAAGIVHRDLKPENIMIRKDGYVKVLDFGLARLVTGGKLKPISQAGVVMGTAKYMSPEQARGTSVSSSSDIFSLGLVFYEMACGRHAFEAESWQGILQAITVQRAVAPSILNRALPERFDQLILQMLEKGPNVRPSAGDVVIFLEELRADTVQPNRRAPLEFHRPKTVVRELERKELISALAHTRSRGGLLFCVSGEAGLGKTTLVEDFLGEVMEGPEQCLVGRGRCSELTAGGEPYLPVLGAIDSLLASDGSGWVARILKLVAPNWYLRLAPADENLSSAIVRTHPAGGSPELMKRELGTFFQALSRERQLIVFFDDLHWADVSTVDAISYLASQFDRNGFLMIATYRESELRLARKSFLGVKLNLQTRNQCRDLDLGCLSVVEVDRYLSLKFPENQFPEDFGAKVHRRTEGHPLFMADLVRYLTNCQTIFRENGLWSLSSAFAEGEGKLPESVRSMIQRKVDLIDEEDLRLLETASLQGYEFDSAVTTKVLEMDPLKVEERLERLERLHRFVRLIGEQDMPNRTFSCRYQFVHSLYQNAFVADLRPVRRKILTSATARVLEECYGDRRGEIAGLLASLHDACMEFGPATENYLLAAQNAATLFAHREAAAMARRGLEMLRELPPSPERDTQELVLQLSLGRSAAIRGYTDPEASACFTRAKELAPILGQEAQFFPAIWGLWVCRFVRAETTETAGLSEQLQGMAGNSSNPILLAGGHYTMALQHVITGNLCRVQEHLEQIISFGEQEKNQARVARLVLDPVVSAQGLFMLVSWSMGHPDQAQARMKNALARIDTEKWDPRSVCDVLIFSSCIQKFCGNFSEVERLSSRVIAICDKYDFSVERQWATFNRGWSLAASGSVGEGIVNMEASLDNLFSKGVMMFAGTLYASELAETLLRVGFPDRAHLRIKEALNFVKRTGHCVFESELHRIEGSLLAKTATDSDRVEECFAQAIEIARKQQARSLELRAATSLARYRASQGRVEAAREALAPVYSGFTEGFDTSDLRQAKTLLEELR